MAFFVAGVDVDRLSYYSALMPVIRSGGTVSSPWWFSFDSDLYQFHRLMNEYSSDPTVQTRLRETKLDAILDKLEAKRWGAAD